MEKLSHNMHMKLQEMCDCYIDSDYLSEIKRSAAGQGADMEEAALKYFALCILETLTQKALQLSVKKKKDKMKVTIASQHEKITLPPPTDEIGGEIFKIMREITHLDQERGEMPLALGLRNGRVDVQVKIKKKEEEESMKLVFPEL